MKRIILFATVFILPAYFLSCNRKKNIDAGTFTVDLTEKYPTKELIAIQDIADVEYIPLETNNEFLCDGSDGIIYIDKEVIIFQNKTTEDFLVFSGAGKVLQKFNRKGQGGEEYLWGWNSFFDKEREELYVCYNSKKLNVYNLSGNFKKYINLPDYLTQVFKIHNFDKNNFLLYGQGVFFLRLTVISKITGEVIKEANIPVSRKNIDCLQSDDMSDLISFYFSGEFPSDFDILVKNNNSFSLNTYFLFDTTFIKINPNMDIEPVLLRKPSLDNDFLGLLFVEVETPDYLFMRLSKKTFDFLSIPLVLNKQTEEITEQNFYNKDDLNKKNIYFGLRPENIKHADNNTYYALLQAYQLKDLYEKGELQDKLKEIASEINEDDNPVLMIVKFKNK
jgi:hypothetical protein